MNRDSLPMQEAYATWVQGEDENQWVVRNRHGEELHKFPANWDEHKCMGAIRLARSAEKAAFEAGKKEGSKESERLSKGVLRQTDKHIRFIEAQNEKLSNKLEELIIGKEN